MFAPKKFVHLKVKKETKDWVNIKVEMEGSMENFFCKVITSSCVHLMISTFNCKYFVNSWIFTLNAFFSKS